MEALDKPFAEEADFSEILLATQDPCSPSRTRPTEARSCVCQLREKWNEASFSRIGDGRGGRTQTGKLGMLWSSWGEHRYAQGIAYSTSGSIKDPWVQEKDVFKGDNSGHGMLFRTFEGRLLFILHHAEANGPRKPQLWNVDDSGDTLMLGDRYR